MWSLLGAEGGGADGFLGVMRLISPHDSNSGGDGSEYLLRGVTWREEILFFGDMVRRGSTHRNYTMVYYRLDVSNDGEEDGT